MLSASFRLPGAIKAGEMNKRTVLLKEKERTNPPPRKTCQETVIAQFLNRNIKASPFSPVLAASPPPPIPCALS